MKTVGILASLRREGNTAKIVKAILEGAKAKGSETDVIHLGDLEIAPCNACNACARGDGPHLAPSFAHFLTSRSPQPYPCAEEDVASASG
jgi:multimeric flavodoxin WrbA